MSQVSADSCLLVRVEPHAVWEEAVQQEEAAKISRLKIKVCINPTVLSGRACCTILTIFFNDFSSIQFT